MIPKFRGKRKDNGEWVVGVPIPNSFCNVVHMIPILLTDKVAYPPERLHEYLIEIMFETLGQSTGLCDKNGVEIFEGDICKIQRIPSGMKPIFVVSDYIKEKLIFSKITIFDQNSYEEQGGYTGNFLEVIGNRFENPELLEAK